MDGAADLDARSLPEASAVRQHEADVDMPPAPSIRSDRHAHRMTFNTVSTLFTVFGALSPSCCFSC